MAKKKKAIFEIPEGRVDRLDELMSKCELETRKDLISNALSLFEWAVEQVQGGKKVVALDEESQNYVEVVLPALVNIIKNKT